MAQLSICLYVRSRLKRNRMNVVTIFKPSRNVYEMINGRVHFNKKSTFTSQNKRSTCWVRTVGLFGGWCYYRCQTTACLPRPIFFDLYNLLDLCLFSWPCRFWDLLLSTVLYLFHSDRGFFNSAVFWIDYALTAYHPEWNYLSNEAQIMHHLGSYNT